MKNRKIFRAIERFETEIPLSDVMDGVKLDIYKDIQSKQYFNFSLRGDKLVLLAGNHIGLIPLNDRIALLVEPKVARQNWLYIVGKAEAYLKELNYLRYYSKIDTYSESIVEFIIRAYIHLLQSIDSRGIYKIYRPVIEETSFPNGRILLGHSIKHVWPRGHSRVVEIERYIFTTDSPFNRLLKYALHISIQSIKSLSIRPNNHKAYREYINLVFSIKDLEDLFWTIPLDPSLKYVSEVLNKLNNQAIPEIREYYINVCRTALLIVEKTGLLPTTDDGDSTLSFVFNMEEIFEDYCLNLLYGSINKFKWINVVKGKTSKQKMFSGDKCDKRDVEPDILIISNNNDTFPIEVKYKEMPNRDNINQAITYALIYKKKKAIIVCFTDNEQKSGWFFLGTVGNIIDVWVYFLFLNSDNITEEESKFVNSIQDAISYC